MPFDPEPLQIPKSLGRPRPRIDPETHLLATGDIHGCGRLLTGTMQAFRTVTTGLLPPARHREVVVLSDFIDRGPSSLSVLQALYGSWHQYGFTVLLGNHEAILLDCIDGRARPFDGWLDFGGDAFLKSLGIEPPGAWEADRLFRDRLVATIRDSLVEWLRSLPCSYTCCDFYFTHTRIRPGVRLEQQEREDLLWIRQPFLSSRRDHGKLVVHGHSMESAICVRRNRIGIDTGAYRSGPLPGLVLQGARAWSLGVRAE